MCYIHKARFASKDTQPIISITSLSVEALDYAMSPDLKTLNPTYQVTIHHKDAGNNFLQNNGTYLTTMYQMLADCNLYLNYISMLCKSSSCML